MKKRYYFIGFILVFLLFWGLSGKTRVSAFSIKSDTITIYEGETFFLDSAVDDADWNSVRVRSTDRAVSTATKDGAALGLSVGTCMYMITDCTSGEESSLEVNVVSKKDVTMVAITIDDGPGSYEADFLDFLDSRNVKATFFLLGTQVAAYKSTLRRLVDDGHELGSHGYSHKQMTKMTGKAAIKEIQSTNKALKKATGVQATVFRPPYGDWTEYIRDHAKLPIVLWNVDTLDWKYRDAARVESQIINGAKNGNIILIHEVYSTTLEGLKKAVDKLLAQGVRFVTATTLLTRDGSDPKDLKGQVFYSKRS